MSESADVRGSDGQSLAGKYLTLGLADEEYGIEILKVREIIGLMEFTTVPRTPEHIRGVINLRGRIIPVLDLRLKFGMEPIDATDETCIIVLDNEVDGAPNVMGILVDRVCEVLDINGDEISPAPSFGDGVNGNFILGMARREGQVTILLNSAEILQADVSLPGADVQAVA